MRRIRELVYIGWLKMTVKMSSKFNKLVRVTG